jgi:FkbM family methyltransferase
MQQVDEAMNQILNIINTHPYLCPRIESIAALAQGKGYGAATIDQEIKMVLQLLNKQPILAIDIGGNIGDYTQELRRINPDLEIHIFEPSDTNIIKLNERFKNDFNINILPFAVSNASGTATLYSNESGSGLGSLAKRRLDHFNIAFDTTEAVNTIRFEDYWNTKLDKRNMDIVKIDIEGHELIALEGFGDAILSTKVLQFEFGGCNIDTRTYFQDFWYFFKEYNFSIFRITPFGATEIIQYQECDEFFSTTNYIAVNKRA